MVGAGCVAGGQPRRQLARRAGDVQGLEDLVERVHVTGDDRVRGIQLCRRDAAGERQRAPALRCPPRCMRTGGRRCRGALARSAGGQQGPESDQRRGPAPVHEQLSPRQHQPFKLQESLLVGSTATSGRCRTISIDLVLFGCARPVADGIGSASSSDFARVTVAVESSTADCARLRQCGIQHCIQKREVNVNSRRRSSK
jgi:hypothetical protein